MFVTHYWIRTPENEQGREHTDYVAFRLSDLAAIPELGRHWRKPDPCLPRLMALELVNLWNKQAETYRYWID